MAQGGPVFHRTESITRTLTAMIFSVLIFFALVISGFYLSSRETLAELGRRYHMSQLSDFARQINQVQETYKNIADAKPQEFDFNKNQSVLKAASNQEEHLFANALAASQSDPEIASLFRAAHDASTAHKTSLIKVLSGSPEFDAELLIAKHLALEATDALSKVQIRLKAKTDASFLRIYEKRLHPLIVGVGLTLVFMGVSFFAGFRLVRRFNSGVNGLLKATTHVSSGKLVYRAPIVRHDEIGQLTDAFNKMTESLQESTVSKHMVENIIESMLDSLIVINAQGKIQQINRETLEVFGYTQKELIGQPYQILFFDNIEISTSAQGLETICVAKSGKKIPVSVNFSILSGDSQDLVCVIHDITERKRVEDEIKARNLDLAAANKELEAFSYSVSHDLRAPLRGIDGFSQALIEDMGPRLEGEDLNYLTRIRLGVQRMGQLIDDMLNLSKLSRKEMNLKPIDLTAMAQEVFAELKASEPERKAELMVTEKIKVTADENLVRILLENLIGNAWKYSSKKPFTKIEIGATTHLDRKMYYIRDNGAGFDMTYSKKLFGAFQRLHREDEFPGTGVGLATALRIVHRHGGSIDAEGEIDKGATIYFAF